MAASLIRILLSVAYLGTLTSSIFCGLVIIAARRFEKRRCSLIGQPLHFAPAISVLKPLHGTEPGLELNIDSFFRQKYSGTYELLFCARHEHDEGLQLAQRISGRYPKVNARFITCGEPLFLNPKVYSLRALVGVAEHDLLIISDADVRVRSDYLASCIQELAVSKTDLASCLYLGIVDRSNFVLALDALGKSVEMSSGALVADMLGGADFALGPTMILRRRVFDEVGGFEELGRYYAEDFVLGNRLAAQGRGVAIATHVIELVVTAKSMGDSFRSQLRWMQSTRRSRPWGHLGTGLTFAMPFGLLGFFTEASRGQWSRAIFFALMAIFNRLIQSSVVLKALGATKRLVPCLMYPLRDLLGSVLWVCSYVPSATHYRGARFHIMRDGTIAPSLPSDGAVVNAPVELHSQLPVRARPPV